MAVIRSDGRDLDARLFRLRADGHQVEVDTLASGEDGRTLGLGRGRPPQADVRPFSHELFLGRALELHGQRVSPYAPRPGAGRGDGGTAISGDNSDSDAHPDTDTDADPTPTPSA